MSTVQPYPAGTLWTFRNRQAPDVEFTRELALLWELDGTPMSDDYTPAEISARVLLQLWMDAYADRACDQWPDRYVRGEVRIDWTVTTPERRGVFERAPHLAPHPSGESYGEDFLKVFTDPVHAETGERINWLRVPVLDLSWSGKRADKSGFVQEVLGWKPAPLQDRVNVRQLERAAGLPVSA